MVCIVYFVFSNRRLKQDSLGVETSRNISRRLLPDDEVLINYARIGETLFPFIIMVE